MLANPTLATLSDVAYQSAFAVYLIALVISLIYYGKMQGVIDRRRERDNVASRELIAVGATPRGIESENTRAGNPVTDQHIAKQEASANRFGGVTQNLVWLGIIIHLASIVLRGLSTQRFPFGNLYEYVSLITAITMVVAAAVIQSKEWRAIWPWLLTPILALVFFGGAKLYSEAAPVVPALQSNWFPIHVSTVSIGAAIGMVSGIASLMYLLRIWQPKGQERGFFGAVAKPLPSAKKLDGLAYKTAIITLPLFGLGVVLGAIWAEAAWGRFWGWDPKESVSFITWILYAAYLHARATAGWRNYKAAFINILALASMIFNVFFINMVVSGLHSYAGLN